MAARWHRGGLARMKASLQAQVDGGRIPGAVAVIGRGTQVDLVETFGRLDPAQDHAMPQDAIFRIYSMTKPVVSVAAMILAEEGLLQMNDPLSKFLPEFAHPKVAVEDEGQVLLVDAPREATVHDLLRHTAGFTYDFLGNNAVQRMYIERQLGSRRLTNREFCRVLASIPLKDAPGTWFQYSVATDVLASVVEQASGRTLGQFLGERLFAPLGMRDTAFSVPEANAGRIADAFPLALQNSAAHWFDPRKTPAYESGGGGLLSTAADYVRFLQMLQGRGSVDGVRLLSRKTVEWMTADHLCGIPAHNDLLLPGYGFGLGFAVRTHAGLAPQPGSVGQYYWSGIGGTSFFVDPQEDLFAMLLTQAPNERIFIRNLFRHLVYAALD